MFQPTSPATRSDHTVRIVGRAYGRTAGIEGPITVIKQIGDRLPPGWAPASETPERTWRVAETPRGLDLVVDEEVRADSLNSSALLDLLSKDLELWMAENAAHLIFVHAGVVCFGDRAILLPGESRSGKSTLVTALLDRGATYYSDEFAVIDARGFIHPYPRRPHLRPDASARSRAILDRPYLRGGPPARLRLVAALTWDPGAGTNWTAGTHAHAAIMMLRHAVAARSRPDEALAAIATASKDAVVLTGRRGEAAEAALALREQLDRSESPRRHRD